MCTCAWAKIFSVDISQAPSLLLVHMAARSVLGEGVLASILEVTKYATILRTETSASIA